MKKTTPVLVTCAALTLLCGCNLAKTLLGELTGDDGASVGAEPATDGQPLPVPSATTAPSVTAPSEPTAGEAAGDEADRRASNEGAVKRFDSESQVVGDAEARKTLVALDAAQLLEAPPDGELVRALPKDTQVERVAQHQGHTLVLVEDPDDQQQLLLGWLIDSALAKSTDTASDAPSAEPSSPIAAPKPIASPKPSPPPKQANPPKVAPKPSPPPKQANPPKVAPKPSPDPEPKKKKKKKVGETL